MVRRASRVSGGRHVIDHEIAAELDALAYAIGRMRPPQNNNPDAFHEDRSELAANARRLALRCRVGALLEKPVQPAAPVGRQKVSHAVQHIAGRTVLVLTKRQAQASGHGFY